MGAWLRTGVVLLVIVGGLWMWSQWQAERERADCYRSAGNTMFAGMCAR